MSLFSNIKERLNEANSEAAAAAKRQGLVSVGYGKWADKTGTVVAKTVNHKLVPVNAPEAAEDVKPGQKKKVDPHNSAMAAVHTKKSKEQAEKDAETATKYDKDGHPEGTSEEDKALWAQMSEKMTTNLKDKQEPIGDYAEVSGPAGDNAKNIFNNMNVHLSQYRNFLTEDKEAAVGALANGVTDLLANHPEDFAHIDAKHMDELMKNSIDKIIHQEVESARVTYTDHGIRHIMGNVMHTDHMMTTMGNNGWDVSPMDRFMGMITHVNHDMGYGENEVAADPAKGKKHIELGGKIWHMQKQQWNAGKIFDEAQFDRMTRLIGNHQYGANHGADDLGYGKVDSVDHVEITVRLADNLAMFQKEKTPAIFEYVPDSSQKLMDMGIAVKDGDMKAYEKMKKDYIKTIKGLKTLSDGREISKNMRKDLLTAAGKINPLTPKFSMGILAGHIESIDTDDDAELVIKIKHNEFDEHLQRLFDMGQQKVRGMLKDYGQIDKDYDGPVNDTEFNFGSPHPHSGKKTLVKLQVIGSDKSKKKNEAMSTRNYQYGVRSYLGIDPLMEVYGMIEESMDVKEKKIWDSLMGLNKEELIHILEINDAMKYNLRKVYDQCTEKELKGYIVTFKMMGGNKFQTDITKGK